MNITIVFSLLYSLLSFLGGTPQTELTFESLESLNSHGGPVYNKISLTRTESRDIWFMKQSHHGQHAEIWDEVKIIVHKERKPFQVSYHQLKNGVEIEYKTSCFRCHSSGPRLIRPKKLLAGPKLQLMAYNSLIKSYGATVVKPNEPFNRAIPFQVNPSQSQAALQVSACKSCHQTGGVRGPLLQEHAPTIEFMIQKGLMPPWPHQLTKSERAEIQRFIHGF